MGQSKYWMPGNYVEITISNNRICYGVVSAAEHLAVMDYCDTKKLTSKEIELLSVLFEVPVMKYGIGKNGWPLAGKIAINENLNHHPHYYKKDPINGKLGIVDSSFMNEVPATESECVGLEEAAVFDPEHIVERLNEHYGIH